MVMMLSSTGRMNGKIMRFKSHAIRHKPGGCIIGDKPALQLSAWKQKKRTGKSQGKEKQP